MNHLVSVDTYFAGQNKYTVQDKAMCLTQYNAGLNDHVDPLPSIILRTGITFVTFIIIRHDLEKTRSKQGKQKKKEFHIMQN